MDRSVLFLKATLVLLCVLTAPAVRAWSQETIAPASTTMEARVSIDAAKKFEPISPYIYGQLIEHLGRCIYGGIWAEMLEDRKFYFPVPAQGEIWRFTREKARVLAASPWKVIGPNEAVQPTKKDAFVGEQSVQINAPGGTRTGIYQEELALVKGRTCVGYIWLAGDTATVPVTVSLAWGEGDKAESTFTIKKVEPKYTKVTFKFIPREDTENGRLSITTTGKITLKIGCVSLMPGDNVEGFRKDTLTLLKELGAPVYRWPGGNFVSGYDWRDGLGDRDKRPTRTNPAWTGIETNDMGMHEFVRLCELIGAEPMIAVNTGFGDAYSAAAEVEYANGSTKTPMGAKRAADGHPKPFGVKWWCVGNEMWGNWQLGYMALNQYVLKHNWVEEKMRRVDPTIKTVGSGDVGDAGPRSWSRGMLTSCADHMDLLSEHFYCQERPDLVAHVQQIPTKIKQIADAHREFRKSIPALQGKDVRVALDEWNYWYGPHVFGELGTRYFLKDGLGIAAGLHEYFRNSDIFFMANYAQTVNVIGCIKTNKTSAAFETTALPLMLYRKQFGTIPIQATDSNTPLDVSAALTADGKTLTIGVVNPTFDIYQLKIEFNAVAPAGPAKTWVIAGDDPMAYNDPNQAPRIAITEANNAELTDIVSVKPLSITLFRAPVR
jgi:alpha-L-arabinofuranosidase